MWSLRRYNFFSFPHTILGRPEMLIHTVFEEAHDGISTHAFRGLSICEVNLYAGRQVLACIAFRARRHPASRIPSFTFKIAAEFC